MSTSVQELHKRLEMSANALEEMFCGAGSRDEPFLSPEDLLEAATELVEMANIINLHAKQIAKVEKP